MTEKNEKKYPPYWNDDRSASQIAITQRLAQSLSEMNHQRKKAPILFQQNGQFLFVTIGGVPPNENQFIDLKFPGKVVNFHLPGFKDENQQNKETLDFSKISMNNTCEQIKSIILSNNYNQAVFVYHSFGGSVVAWFCDLYPKMIKGLICIGGSPIKFYPIIKDYTKATLSIPNITREFVIQNYDVVYSLYDQKTKNQNKWTRFKNKQQLLSFSLHNDLNTLNSLFEKIRKLPLPILMIYGNKDEVITPKLCSQAMIYNTYLRKQNDDQKIKNIKKRYLELVGQSEANKQNKELAKLNIQQKLIYFIEGGHSINISSKNNRLMQPMIDEYLYLILGGKVVKNEQKINYKNQQGKALKQQVKAKL